MNSALTKVIVAYISVLGLGAAALWGMWFLGHQAHWEYEKLKAKATTLNKEIDAIGDTSNALNSKLSFYEDYFKKKRSIYVLEIWGIVEYILPSNNFVQSVSMQNDSPTISLNFAQSEIDSLLKVYRNLNELKDRGLISEYTIGSIDLEGGETLLDSKYKLYKLSITFNPNIFEDNSIMIDFLRRMDKYYNSIYSWPLKKVECEEYVSEEDGETYCKEINESSQESLKEAIETETLREEEEKALSEKQATVTKKKEEANKVAEQLSAEDEKLQKQATEKINPNLKQETKSVTNKTTSTNTTKKTTTSSSPTAKKTE